MAPMNKTPEHALNPDTGQASENSEEPSITSQQLFGTSRQLLILHQGETYTLRITHRGKLILTK